MALTSTPDLKLPGELKLADIVSAFKKEDSILTENYRPISLLPITSKIFERIMLNQITTYMNIYPLIFVDTERF